MQINYLTMAGILVLFSEDLDNLTIFKRRTVLDKYAEHHMKDAEVFYNELFKDALQEDKYYVFKKISNRVCAKGIGEYIRHNFAQALKEFRQYYDLEAVIGKDTLRDIGRLFLQIGAHVGESRGPTKSQFPKWFSESHPITEWEQVLELDPAPSLTLWVYLYTAGIVTFPQKYLKDPAVMLSCKLFHTEYSKKVLPSSKVSYPNKYLTLKQLATVNAEVLAANLLGVTPKKQDKTKQDKLEKEETLAKPENPSKGRLYEEFKSFMAQAKELLADELKPKGPLTQVVPCPEDLSDYTLTIEGEEGEYQIAHLVLERK